MSEKNDELLDANVSRLLASGNDAPKLSEEMESKMLQELKAKQVEVCSPKPARPARTPPVGHSIPWRVLALLLFFFLLPFGVRLIRMMLVEDSSHSPVNTRASVVKLEAEDIKRSTLEDGTILIAHRGSKYSINAPRMIALDQGDVYLIVAKSDKPFVVKTKHGEVRATGTRFVVSSGVKTQAAVAQGCVTLKGAKGRVQLQAGQRGVLEDGKRPTRGPAPRLSYLISWAKEALAQDELLVKKGEKENGLIALDPWGQQTRLSLRKYNVDVHIEDGIARTTIDQTFFNHYPWNTEGTFYFPLPPDASVSRLAMYVNGQLNEGGMVERGRGQEIYTDILHQRRDPALLEMMEGNVFKMRIFPLEGRQEKRIFLSYTQKLDELYETMRYWFPMDHTNSVAGQLSIRVRVKDGAKLYDPRSSTHELASNTDGDDLVLEYEAKKTKPDQDLLLHLIRKDADDESSHLIRTCEKDGFNFVFGRFSPKVPGKVEVEPRQWIVLNDISASRSKIDAEAQRYILKRLLEEADDDDSVFLIDVNTRAESVSAKFNNVRSAEAKKLLKHRAAANLGATNIVAGIEAAVKVIEQQKSENPHLLYLGDGVATDGKTEVFSLVRAIPKGVTFVGVGVGKKVDSLFLQSAADQTGGMFTTINPDEDIDWRVFDMLAALNTPRITGIRVTLKDSAGKKVAPNKAIAYPSSRSLSEGETLTIVARCNEELPEKIALEGKVASKPFKFETSLDKAVAEAEFIPRLWAKRHLDELSKSDMEMKDEIVELSKQYYVVTPHTSLIVLEDDAMYEEYKVERGRKDHWALYDAPKNIEVVKEPVDWNRWSWWGGTKGEDEKIKAKAKPKSVQEIVDSVQLRINAPFYFPQPQPSGQGRFAIYELLDNKADPTKLLTYLFIRAGGKASDSSPDGDTEKSSDGDDVSIEGKLKKELTPLFDQVDGYYESRFALLGGGRGGGFGGGGFFMPAALASLDVSNGKLVSDLVAGELLPQSVSFDFEDVGQVIENFERPQLSLMMGNSVTASGPVRMPTSMRQLGLPSFGSHRGGYGRSVSPEVLQSFQHALGSRIARVNRDVQRFNQQYGYGHWGGWNSWRRGQSIDLTKSAGGSWYGGLEGLLSGSGQASADPGLIPALQQQAQGERPELALMLIDASRSMRGEQMAVAWIGVFKQGSEAIPGTCSVLAADYLVARSDKLLSEESQNAKKEAKLIRRAIANIQSMAAKLEQSGVFWDGQGWDYRPRPWTFQPPIIQVHHNFNWSFDLTRYAPGLYSNSSDILNEVVEQFSGPAAGSISDEAKERIDAARKAVKAIKDHFAEDGPKVLVAAGDRFVVNYRTNMYLEQRMVCDGEDILHVYDELGLAARRSATQQRLASLRRHVPHLLEPVSSLVQHADVELQDNDKSTFTLKLTPVDQKKDAEIKVSLVLKVDSQGRLHSKTFYADDQPQLKLDFKYNENEITASWTGKEDKELGEWTYHAEPFDVEVDTFETDLSMLVVFDMPLRKPSYYAQNLEQLGDDELEAKIDLKRHFALASIQELQWRRWGNANNKVRETLTEAFEVMKQSGQKAKLGDITLLGSAGGYKPLEAVTVPRTFDDDHPIVRYFNMRYAGVKEIEKLREEHPDGLVGHLAAYQAMINQYQKSEFFDHLIDKYPRSPLLLAATYYRSSWAKKPESWFKLYDHPKWRAIALLMSANLLQTDEHKGRFEAAFEEYYEEVSEKGYEAPITPEIATLLKNQKPDTVWKSIVKDRFDRMKKLDRTAPLLRFAEAATSWGETHLADESLQLARERLAEHGTLLTRFALAQTYWAGDRLQKALDLYDEILETLEEKSVDAPPALLASVARLAQQAGDHARAIDLEEKALELEHPFLPELINLQAFRQRYNWLWQQYQAKVHSAVDSKDKDAVRDWLNRAEATWQRWRDIDRENRSMMQQMATLQMSAGMKDDAWLYLSTAIDQRPKDAQSYYTIGQWHHGRGELDETQQWYGQAYKWDTANPRWLFERGQILKQMGRNKDANELFQQIVDGKWAPGLQGYAKQAKSELNQ